MKAIRFPENFALGAASAATQIDGDCRESNWYDWYLKGRIKDNSNPDIATDHRGHLEEDTRLMAEMGIRHYRFGLEWARLEPREGEFSEEELQKVRQEITLLRQNGIEVLLTLHHFSNPMWFERQGGFLRSGAVERYLAMVEYAVRGLGDLVGEYVTVNEPNVYAFCGYLGGGFPPGECNPLHALRIMKVLGECHRRAYRLIHTIHAEMGWPEPKVGFAAHMRAFTPYSARNLWHRLACRISEYLFQTRINRTYLLGNQGPYADFLGLNYYARTATSGLGDGTLPGVAVNDLGWEIYPAGIVECCRKLHALLPQLPIYITENGTADNHDSFRRRYLYEHLKALTESGLPVTRYYHWCFVDNFEWLEGFTARFGLIHFDPVTHRRTVKKSGEFYARMIAEHGITEQMAREAAGEEYHYG